MSGKLTITLPLPPSVNSLYRNVPGRGRVKTGHYRAWLLVADAAYYEQRLFDAKPVSGKAELRIVLPAIRGDATNKIKALEDFLVSRKLTDDDKNNKRVSVEVDESAPPHVCTVHISQMDPDYDSHDDITKSFEEAYSAIRKRIAAGGPGWPSDQPQQKEETE